MSFNSSVFIYSFVLRYVCLFFRGLVCILLSTHDYIVPRPIHLSNYCYCKLFTSEHGRSQHTKCVYLTILGMFSRYFSVKNLLKKR